jgi:hypothetical protein
MGVLGNTVFITRVGFGCEVIVHVTHSRRDAMEEQALQLFCNAQIGYSRVQLLRYSKTNCYGNEYCSNKFLYLCM